MTVPRLDLRGASKTFGAAKVLDDVHLAIAAGEIHGLVGANGSGKSTLVKILTGYHAPDPGMVLSLDGQQLPLPVQWQTASAAGIAVVHQDLGLLDHLTVCENIGVGGYLRTGIARRIDWAAQRAMAADLLDRLELPLSPDALVGELTAAHRAGVAIARALRGTPDSGGLMVLDEATRALPRAELARFHTLLRRVVASGTAVLMVSHNLDEVLTMADRVTVLRDGQVVGAGLATREHSEHDLARLMLGQSIRSGGRSSGSPMDGPPAAVVEGVRSATLASVTFTVGRGEVVGLTGLPGSGFEQVPYLISGALQATAGSVTTARGRVDLRTAGVGGCIRAGVALVPERRDRDGLAVDLSIQDNIAVPDLRRRGKPWFVGRDWQRSATEAAITELGIKTRSALTLVKELSGGNQQKVLLAKWLAVGPQLLVLHEPTQAVDVGARQDLLAAVDATASGGIGVLLVSMEPTDLAEACDRVLVMTPDGRLTELRTDDPDDVLAAVYGATPATSTTTGSPTGAQHG